MITDLPTEHISNVTVAKISWHFAKKWRQKMTAMNVKQNYITVIRAVRVMSMFQYFVT